MKLDNTPIGMEERLECQRMQISDQDVIKGNNEIMANLNNVAAANPVQPKTVSISIHNLNLIFLFLAT